MDFKDDDIESLKKDLLREEDILRSRLILEDAFDLPGGVAGIRRIGGLDISFFKNDPIRALAALVVLDAGSLEIVYEEYKWIDLSGPYIPTFLGFREATPFVELLENCRMSAPEIYPDVVLCDGNGTMHPRGFGLACHVGVRTNTPSIGVAKKLLEVDGITKEHVPVMRGKLHKKGDYELLRGVSGSIWGACLRTTDASAVPVFVSQGHRVSLESTVHIVTECSEFRIPEPIRCADLGSRGVIRKEERKWKS